MKVWSQVGGMRPGDVVWVLAAGGTHKAGPRGRAGAPGVRPDPRPTCR